MRAQMWRCQQAHAAAYHSRGGEGEKTKKSKGGKQQAVATAACMVQARQSTTEQSKV